MQDLAVTLSQSHGSGIITVEFPLTPQGSLQAVSGGLRMVQRVVRWLTTPAGSLPYDPSFGNPFFGSLGTASRGDAGQWLVWLKQAEYDFLQRQRRAIQNGTLADDETVDHFANETAAFPTPIIVALDFQVVSVAGTAHALPGPISFNLAA